MTKKEILDKMDSQRKTYVLALKEAQDKHLEVMDKHLEVMDKLRAELKEVEGEEA